MSDRGLAAKGIRAALELWPDENHWCQGQLTDVAEDGTLQRCTYQVLCEGFHSVLPPAPAMTSVYRVALTPPFQAASGEIVRIANARKAAGAPQDFSVCDVNNGNDFVTVKNIVEEAAANLERAQ